MQENNNKPVQFEKISLSPKRMIYVKLWAPSTHPKWGMTRSSIEIQEVKIFEDKTVSYGSSIRFPCDGSTALLSSILNDYLIEGRRLVREFAEKEGFDQKNEKRSDSPKINAVTSGDDLRSLLLGEFRNKRLSKTRILTHLQKQGFEIDKIILLQTLEKLAEAELISKESAVHSSSGTNYTLWSFP